MCGITGYISGNDTPKDLLKKMTGAISHRGPDSFGFFNERTKHNHAIALGHRRLSILDLSDNGLQPMQFDDLVIVFNGEVYHFHEIKKELQNLGYSFISKTDTEVILKSYHCWGIDFIKKLNGMFSIALLDKKLDKFYLIRDRAGVKPLYYYYYNNFFMFSSELKSFHENQLFNKKIDTEALKLFFQHGYILEPFTIFFHAKKIKSGHYIDVNLKNFSFKEIKYWDLAKFYKKNKLKISIEDASAEVDQLLKSSFKYRMIADVPVGIFLSGGYDSSLVTSILQAQSTEKIKTFTIGFNNIEFDESQYAKQISNHLGTEHHEKICTSNDAINIFNQLPYIYDEPFGDPSSIPTVLLSEFTKKYVKASLSADGGDEIFGGYNKYFTISKFLNLSKFCPSLFKSFFPNLDIKKKYKNINLKYYFFQNLFSKNYAIDMMKALTSVFTPSEIKNLIVNKDSNKNYHFTNFNLDEETQNNLSEKDKILLVDFKTYLNDDILVKVDRASMNFGLESREPLLDNNLVEFLAQLPDTYKFNKYDGKYILKKIINKYLPSDLLDRPKMGFSPPLKNWLQKDFNHILKYYFNFQKLKKQKILNVDQVIEIYSDFINGKQDNFFKVWLILIFLSWYEYWFEIKYDMKSRI